MATGIIGGIGKFTTQKALQDSYDVMLVAVQEGVNNWQPYSTAGAGCYVYDYDLVADFPNAIITDSDIFECGLRGAVTDAQVAKFAWINAIETLVINQGQPDEKVVIRFYSFNGQPTDDIPVKLTKRYTTILA